MMAVVEGIPLEALEGGGPWDWHSFAEYLDRVDGGLAVNAGFLVGHSTVRRVVMGDDATRTEATPEQLAAMVRLVEESLAGGALGFSSSLGEGHLDGDGRPVPSSSASFEEFVALAGALRHHPGTTLEFIPAVGPIPEERMQLMADMSLAADRPLNWNLLGSLASEEIYEQQLQASDRAAAVGAHVVALTLPDMMRMRAVHPPARPARLARGHRSRPGRPPGGHRRSRHPGAACGPAPKRWRPAVHGGALRLRADGGGGSGLGVGGPVAGGDRRGPRHRRGRRAHRRGAADGLTLFVVLPSLTPSLGRTDEGWAARVEIWKDPRVMLGGSDAGAHLDLMCHANYPTVVLGEVVRRPGTADAGGGGRDDDRPTGPPLRPAPPGPGRRGVARRSGGLRSRLGGEPAGRAGPRPAGWG